MTPAGELSPVTIADARNSVDKARTSLADAAEQIVWQVRNQAWTVLGYTDWDAMREAEYGGAAVIVPRADRPELVAALHGEGLSQQQIGDTLGVSHQTVARDVVQTDNVAPSRRTDSLGRQQPTTKSRQVPEISVTDSDLPYEVDASDGFESDPIADAKANAKAAPNVVGATVIRDLHQLLSHVKDAGGPEVICAANEASPLADFNADLWAETLDRAATTIAAWRRALRPNLRSVK